MSALQPSPLGAIIPLTLGGSSGAPGKVWMRGNQIHDADLGGYHTPPLISAATNPLRITAYHAKYDAHKLTQRSASDQLAKLGATLLNATLDLNPHQIDAALFAFRSPLSRGAILADEVGLGKTIEAGLIISQLWAERARRILVIAPTTLRKQWAQELLEKFFIHSLVIDARVWAERERAGYADPLDAQGTVLICSYHFARARAAAIRTVPWNLVVIDEAHRLRNVYKTGNKIAGAIKEAVQRHPKLLLTATPLQNTLLELFGLVGFLDEHLFGNLPSFRARYMRGPLDERHFAELKHRLAPVCKRTLRRQVVEYVRYTQRIPITQDFTPTDDEQRLYDGVSAYLLRTKLHALPASQRKLMTLVLRKLLASSTFAVAATLQALLDRLRSLQHAEQPALELENDFESLPDLSEEWSDDNASSPAPDEGQVTPTEIEEEIEELTRQKDLATSITRNAKGQALLIALTQGFEKLCQLGANRKAAIFTESRRTQAYLAELLEANGYAGQVMTLNGTNSDAGSSAIYTEWKRRHAGSDTITGSKEVDLRAALIDHFRDGAAIMIATEAAAEGVNLQFCSLVVNYDLPWNPQRIEQRIGRCHRYGQAHDVVVINFLNRRNEADRRVFQILSEKFRLFDGVFGASDEVLGAIESGVDFEQRIASIYQSCRTPSEIDAAFDHLQEELHEQIGVRMATTRAQLLENFDEDVHRRLRLHFEQARAQIDTLQRALWRLTRHELAGNAVFHEPRYVFELRTAAAGDLPAPAGRYRLLAAPADDGGDHAYRLGHPLAEALVARAKARPLEMAEVVFDYAGHKPSGRVAVVEALQGRCGYLRLERLAVRSLEHEDHLVFCGWAEPDEALDQEQCEKLLSIEGYVLAPADIPPGVASRLEQSRDAAQAAILGRVTARNHRFFDEELDKLDRWAEDAKEGLDQELKDLDAAIKGARRQARTPGLRLEEKIALQRRIKVLETDRTTKRKTLFETQDEIDARKETLLAEVEARLHQTVEVEHLFTIRWLVE